MSEIVKQNQLDRNNEKILRLKIKLAEILTEISWLMPEDEFYETFPDTLHFLEGYY